MSCRPPLKLYRAAIRTGSVPGHTNIRQGAMHSGHRARVPTRPTRDRSPRGIRSRSSRFHRGRWGSRRAAEVRMRIADRWDSEADVTLYLGDTLDLLAQVPDRCAQLVITSPPYN